MAYRGYVDRVLTIAIGASVVLNTITIWFGIRRMMNRDQLIAEVVSQNAAATDRLAHIMAARDQAWFWTPEWQAGEREADEEIRRGELAGAMTEAEFDAYLDRLDAEAGTRAASRVA